MNSFIQNVNYIASLDNKYGDQVYLLKNNLTLMNTANDIVLSFKYFDFNERKQKEINHSKTGVLYSGLELVLQEFIDKVNFEMGIKAIATYQLLNLTIGFSIIITTNVSDIKVNELNFNAKKTQDQIELYNLYGDVKNTLKILPTLAMLDKSVLDGFAIAVRNIDDILYVSDNIEDVINVSDNILSINNTINNIENIKTVSESIDNVNAVGSNIDNVVVVKENIENINLFTENIENVIDVLNNINNINTVSENINSVNIVEGNIENVNTISDSIEDVNSVSINIESVKPVALNIDAIVNVNNNISDIETNADNIVNINKVANNIDNINLTGTSIDNINIVAPKIDKVETVSNNITNVNNVADNSTNINTVSNNISNINSVADNIVDIQNAEENAQIATDKAAEALASEEKAHKWANYPEDQIVQGTFGIDDKYSAYHWAKKAEAAAGGNIGLNSLYDVDVDNVVNGGTIVYNSTTLLWEAYDFARNTKLGFNLNPGTSVEQGELGWNVNEGTLDLGLANGVTLQIGQENVRNVRNDSGSIIKNGTIVMSDGTIGNSCRVKVKPFTGLFNEAHLIYGVATHDIANGADGIITIDGKVRGINTTGTSVGETWADGDLLYVKPEDNGRMTKIVPADDKLKIIVARVIKAHTSGTLEIGFMKFNENMYYNKVQNDILLANKVPLDKDFVLDLGEI